MGVRTIHRTAARVILIDPEDQVLLSNDGWAGRTWWTLPGGALDRGETAAEAALREVAEETGLRDIELGPVVVDNAFRADLPLGRVLAQKESIFVGRTQGGEIDTSGLSPIERTFMRGFRWWTVEDLEATDETVYPADLAKFVRTILDDGPPSQPWVVDASGV